MEFLRKNTHLIATPGDSTRASGGGHATLHCQGYPSIPQDAPHAITLSSDNTSNDAGTSSSQPVQSVPRPYSERITEVSSEDFHKLDSRTVFEGRGNYEDRQPAVVPAKQSARTTSVRPFLHLSPVTSDYTVPLGETPLVDVIENVATENVDQNAAAESLGSPERGTSGSAPAELRLVRVGDKDRCSGCHKEIKVRPPRDFSNWNRHVEEIHGGKKEHRCPICGHESARKNNIAQHLKNQHKIAGTCPNFANCNTSFFGRYRLSRMMEHLMARNPISRCLQFARDRCNANRTL